MSRGETDASSVLSLYAGQAFGRAPFLRGRIERCLKKRGLKGAIVAVDFYQRTSVVDVAKELNSRDR